MAICLLSINYVPFRGRKTLAVTPSIKKAIGEIHFGEIQVRKFLENVSNK